MDEYVVYKHTNRINGKVYVGQTVQEPKIRFLSGHGYKANKHFSSAIKKYGWDSFDHQILAEGLTREEADRLESKYIIEFESYKREKGYNKSMGGDSPTLNEETKRNLAERMREMARRRRGIPMSEEQKKKISESRKGKRVGKDHQFYGRVLSPEELERLRLANIGRPSGVNLNVDQLSLDGIFLKKWDSAKRAGESLDTDVSTITKCCKGKRKTAGGFIWRYSNE
jgi:group I intron endonuclease